MRKQQSFFWNQINDSVKRSDISITGDVPSLGLAIQSNIKQGVMHYPFSEVTFCNIGNPHQFSQKPITFFRQVIACVLDPELISNQTINSDARSRAKIILDQIISAGSYTHAMGLPFVRESVCNFIARMDNIQKPKTSDVLLTEGASEAVHLLMKTLITDKNDAVMIPIPVYPLYTASISLHEGATAPYYLQEEAGWQLDEEELDRAYEEAVQQGRKVKAIVVINPGNPTGAILNSDTIIKIIEFSIRNRLIIIADQVYRENVYKEGTTFVSFRRALETLPCEIKDGCQLASLHSVSKGLLGECGLRGGYLYMHNFNPAVVVQLSKLKSINICSNTVGQLMMELMVNPPLDGVSPQTKAKFETEYKALYDSLKARAKLVTNALNSMRNVRCQEVNGAMYAFPSITFSSKAKAAAEEQGTDVENFYCVEVLKNTGIALVPGSGFMQSPGTHHFRITTLILPETRMESKLECLRSFNETFHKKYESD